MTYEELFIAVADSAKKLPGCGLQLLIHLIATGITEGSNEVHTSARTIAAELHMSRDAVKVAARSLADIIQISGSAGVSSTFVMPAEWFGSQRSLFATAGNVEKLSGWPGNKAIDGRETRPLMAEKPGQGGRETRPSWTDYQANWKTNQAKVDEKPGHNGLEPRPSPTQNQQLTGGADIDRSDQDLTVTERWTRLVDRIAHVDKVEKSQREDAEILRQLLMEYRMQFGQEHLASRPPDDKIVARCLAAAHIEQLQKALSMMAAEQIVPRPKDGWFLTLFLNKIYGVPPELTKTRLRIHFEKKGPQRTQDLEFGPYLVNQTAAAVPSMR